MAVSKPILSRVPFGAEGAAAGGRPRSERSSSERRGNVIVLQGREARLRFAAREAGFGIYVEESERSAFNAFMARVFASHALAGHAKASCELALVHPDKPQQRHLAQIEATLDESGQAVNAVAVDIAEKKRATDELIRSKLDLQQFAYVAAHDSPSRPLEPIGFKQLFDEVVGAMDATIRDSGAAVTRDELPTVAGNRVQLAQVLQNLIDNGIGLAICQRVIHGHGIGGSATVLPMTVAPCGVLVPLSYLAAVRHTDA